MAKFASIDDYIEQAEAFAKPILTELRILIHQACPEVEETFKWNMPHFLYKGKILCSMASFKQHAAFTFWPGAQMADPASLFQKGEDSGMGHLGKIRSLEDLPQQSILRNYIAEAMLLTEAEKSKPSQKRGQKILKPPPFLLEALKTTPAAMVCFEKFSPSHRNEYIEWIEEAKTESTRQRRIAQMIEWLLEGKSRNWKYER